MGFRRTSSEDSIWPGFVDALVALLTVLLFVLTIFIVSYGYLQGMMRQKNASLKTLQNRVEALQGQVLDSSHKLQQEDKQHQNLSHNLEELQRLYQELQALLQAKETDLASQRKAHQADKKNLESQLHEAQGRLSDQAQELEALMAQIKELLARKATEESRSEFLEKLRKALAHHRNVRVVGDRFVFPSEVLFDLGSAALGDKGKKELAALANTLKEVLADIPEDVQWVLRVNGHTDDLKVRPGGKFASNLELSSARAISVVNFLITQGIPARRLAAAGFGEFHPLIPGKPTFRDRRIELMLDQPNHLVE